jgi:hypothetical protein
VVKQKDSEYRSPVKTDLGGSALRKIQNIFTICSTSACDYWAEMVKPCGRPAAITVGAADVTGEVTCGFPAASM